MIYEKDKVLSKNGTKYKERRMAIDTGDRVNDVNIQEAVIHVLDSNSGEPVLNEFALELNEDVYRFLYKHIEKVFKSDELVPAKFNSGRNVVRETVKDYLNGVDGGLIEISKELARLLFCIMKGNVNIPSCDIITTSIITDQGPMIGLLKLDYVNSFTHQVDFIDNKIGVGLVKHSAALPGSSQKIQKAAFIKPIRNGQAFDLWVLDTDKGRKTSDDEYGANYFTNIFLECAQVSDSRTETKSFIRAAESFVRRNITEDAEKAEYVRSTIKDKLLNDESINIDDLSEELFGDSNNEKQEFSVYLKGHGLDDELKIDKSYTEKKFKRTRLKIDKDIDLYIEQEAYKDPSKFEIQKNGDGSINMIIKHIFNYIEK